MIENDKAGARSNTDQLRHDIDCGRTGDKVPGSDPAAAPLGTDDEAAGGPSPRNTAAQARALETARPHHAPRTGGLGATWILIGFIGFLGSGALAWALVYW